MIGITEFDTQSGIHVVGLDYVADPMKRTPEWEAEARRGLDERSWRKEYKRDWTIASGLPVYPDFVQSFHIAEKQLLAIPNRSIIRGWDLGPTHVLPACAFGQLDALGRFNVLYELVSWDGRGDQPQCSIPTFADSVILDSNQLFPGFEFIDYVDPAGWTKSQTDERSAIDILREKGIHPRKGPVTFTVRKKCMEGQLQRAVGGRAALLISPTCRMIIEGLSGAYKYEEIGETGRYKPTVDKNAWSHIINALEYSVGGTYAVSTKKDRDNDQKRRGRVKRDPITGY